MLVGSLNFAAAAAFLLKHIIIVIQYQKFFKIVSSRIGCVAKAIM